MIERIILAGGGTGGHLFPGIAVFEELRRREPDLEALFVGTARGIETKVIPQLGDAVITYAPEVDRAHVVAHVPASLAARCTRQVAMRSGRIEQPAAAVEKAIA